MAYILVADDDPLMGEIVRHRLCLAGHRVRVVEDGLQLLDRLRFERPDTIILDAMMPGKSGFDLIDELRSDPVLSHIPIVMLTSRRGQSDILNALRAGASDYMTKPFMPEELVLRVEGLLSRQRFIAENVPQGCPLH